MTEYSPKNHELDLPADTVAATLEFVLRRVCSALEADNKNALSPFVRARATLDAAPEHRSFVLADLIYMGNTWRRLSIAPGGSLWCTIYDLFDSLNRQSVPG